MPGAGSLEEGLMLKGHHLCGAGGEAGSVRVLEKLANHILLQLWEGPSVCGGEEALVRRICHPEKPKESLGSA